MRLLVGSTGLKLCGSGDWLVKKRLTGKMTLLRYLAALRLSPLASTMVSAKTSLRAIARR